MNDDICSAYPKKPTMFASVEEAESIIQKLQDQNYALEEQVLFLEKQLNELEKS